MRLVSETCTLGVLHCCAWPWCSCPFQYIVSFLFTSICAIMDYLLLEEAPASGLIGLGVSTMRKLFALNHVFMTNSLARLSLVEDRLWRRPIGFLPGLDHNS